MRVTPRKRNPLRVSPLYSCPSPGTIDNIAAVLGSLPGCWYPLGLTDVLVIYVFNSDDVRCAKTSIGMMVAIENTGKLMTILYNPRRGLIVA